MLTDTQPTPRPADTQAAQRQADRRWLVARLGWVALCVLMGALFTISLWYLYAELQVPCAGPTCWDDTFYLTAEQIAALRANGHSPALYAAYQVGLYIVFFLVHAVLATLIFWRRPDDRMARFTAFALLLWSATFPSTPNNLWAAMPVAAYALSIGAGLGGMAFFGFLIVFPNPQFARAWTRWSLALLALYTVLGFVSEYFAQWLPATLAQIIALVRAPFLLLLLAAASVAQISRYRYSSNHVEREQTRWVIFGIVGGICWNMAILLYVNVLNAEWSHTISGKVVANSLIYVGFLFIPLSIGIAILRHRLWDIDLLISRALVYAALTACVIGMYVVTVGYLGTLFRTTNNLPISLVATGLVAVLFQPLRARLQRGVNRLLYGERDNPYAVARHLGQRLEATLAPEAVLPALAETVAAALKLPYTAIMLKQADVWQLAAEHGARQDDLQRFPLVYQGETIGQLLLAPRAPGEQFGPADRRLLAVLSQQAGVAAHAVRLTRDLQQTTDDLQLARERLISAREEERRRIRRDLHDGVGPVLSSLVQRLDVARGMVARNPDAAVALLGDLKGDVRTTLADIRRLVYALRPPALDEFGLVATIREHAAHYHQPEGLQVSVDAPASMPPLPAAVEVAAYRIALEGLTNVARHARASRCQVSLTLIGTDDRRALCVEVADDGVGVPDDPRAGVGLTSMRERATELGGTCVIERGAAGGTRLAAWLPLPME